MSSGASAKHFMKDGSHETRLCREQMRKLNERLLERFRFDVVKKRCASIIVGP